MLLEFSKWDTMDHSTHAIGIFVALLVSIGSCAKPYTQREIAALETFRSLVESELYQDFMKKDDYLMRWIHYQNFNLTAASTMLNNAIQWRKRNNIDNILTEDFDDIKSKCRYTLDAKDKFGKPILTLDLGSCQMRSFITTGQGQKLKRMFYLVFEQRSKLVEDSGSEDGLVIADFVNFRIRDQGCFACIPIMLEILQLYESFYPHYVYAYFMINVPWALELLLPTTLPKYLSRKTIAGLHVYGYNIYDWREAIRNFVPANQLETQYGGTRGKPPQPVATYYRATDPDPPSNAMLPNLTSWMLVVCSLVLINLRTL